MFPLEKLKNNQNFRNFMEIGKQAGTRFQLQTQAFLLYRFLNKHLKIRPLPSKQICANNLDSTRTSHKSVLYLLYL